MLRLDNVTFSYGEKLILKNFTLLVNDGECVALKGESGCGKSTVAKLLLGLIKQNCGNVSTPNKISVVFQEDRFLERQSLSRNLKTVLNKEQLLFAKELMKELGLYSERHKKIYEYSGGMKRRAAIIRAIAFGGDALILDEALNGIDRENKVKCAELIKKYFIDKNKPVLFITHIDDDALLLNSKITEMEKATA